MSNIILFDVKNDPFEELIGLLKGFEGVSDLFYSSRPPFCIQKEEIIPRSIFHIIFVKLSFQLSLILFVNVLVDVRSHKSVKLFFLKAIL